VPRRYAKQQFCSAQCATRTRLGTDEKDRRRTCAACGLEFVALFDSARYCNQACGAFASNARRPRRQEKTTP
jgi:hypothetical protein